MDDKARKTIWWDVGGDERKVMVSCRWHWWVMGGGKRMPMGRRGRWGEEGDGGVCVVGKEGNGMVWVNEKETNGGIWSLIWMMGKRRRGSSPSLRLSPLSYVCITVSLFAVYTLSTCMTSLFSPFLVSTAPCPPGERNYMPSQFYECNPLAAGILDWLVTVRHPSTSGNNGLQMSTGHDWKVVHCAADSKVLWTSKVMFTFPQIAELTISNLVAMQPSCFGHLMVIQWQESLWSTPLLHWR